VVVRRFPNEADQIAFVAAGRGAMPAFGATLSPVELRQVVDYTRTGLGK
jgi:mono/diheme cytochrome c family protein